MGHPAVKQGCEIFEAKNAVVGSVSATDEWNHYHMWETVIRITLGLSGAKGILTSWLLGQCSLGALRRPKVKYYTDRQVFGKYRKRETRIPRLQNMVHISVDLLFITPSSPSSILCSRFLNFLPSMEAISPLRNTVFLCLLSYHDHFPKKLFVGENLFS